MDMVVLCWGGSQDHFSSGSEEVVEKTVSDAAGRGMREGGCWRSGAAPAHFG